MSSGREAAQAKRASGPLADAAAGAGTAVQRCCGALLGPVRESPLPETAWAFSMLAR